MGKLKYLIAELWQMGLLILFLVPNLEGSTIEVSNGGPWGSWDIIRMCPSGSKAHGFNLRVEQPQGEDDDTGLNGIRLLCKYEYSIGDAVVEVSGHWGQWTTDRYCSSGYLDSFALRVDCVQDDGDDTAVNNMAVRCSNGDMIYGKGLSLGSWGKWSSRCPEGVCGFRVKLENPQASGDDTALNDVQMICC